MEPRRDWEFSNKARVKRYPALTSTGGSYGVRNQPSLASSWLD